jgi:quercetin dioxygenase-like cupin family protein
MSEHIDAPAPFLPPCKRYITTHSPAGKSIYIDSPAQVYHPVPGVGAAARSYAIGSVPAHLADDADLAAYRAEDGVTSHRRRDTVLPQPGANLVVVDLEPGAVSEMHRTVSVDFSVCVVGEIDHELDGGETVRLFPGVSEVGLAGPPRLLGWMMMGLFVADVLCPLPPFRIISFSEVPCTGGLTRRKSRRGLWLALSRAFPLTSLGSG